MQIIHKRCHGGESRAGERSRSFFESKLLPSIVKKRRDLGCKERSFIVKARSPKGNLLHRVRLLVVTELQLT